MWANKRMVIIYYVTNLFCGIILMLPFRSMLEKFAAHSLMGKGLAGRFSMDFLFEFLEQSGNPISLYGGLINEAERYAIVVQKVGEVTPVVDCRLDGENDAAAVGLHHICPARSSAPSKPRLELSNLNLL